MADPLETQDNAGGVDASSAAGAVPPALTALADSLDSSAVPDSPAVAAARAAPTADGPRWGRIEALARRAENHQGATRRLLDARLAALLAEHNAAVQHAAASPGKTPATGPAAPSGAPVATRDTTGPLHALLAALAPARDSADTVAAPALEPSGTHPPELRAVRQHRATWARLRAEQRVAQTQAALPDQAGPLNSQRLLHRALTAMRDTAPGYLQHLMGQVEALMWLEQAQARPAADAPRSTPSPKPGKGLNAAKTAAARGKSAKAPARSRSARPPPRDR